MFDTDRIVLAYYPAHTAMFVYRIYALKKFSLKKLANNAS
jgi:hypothetical protein